MRLLEVVLLEAKDEYVAKTFGPKIANVANIKVEDPTKLIELVLAFVRKNLVPLDPTPNQKFLVWIAKLYADGKLLHEDFYKVPEYLKEFMAVQQRLPVKDIMKYNNLPDLIDAIDEIKGVAQPGIELTDERKKLIKKGAAELVYQNKGTTVVKLNNKAASCEFGRGTKWCTAGNKNNQFADYHNHYDLYVIYIKGEKPHQVSVHRAENTAGQIHDASDRSLSSYDKKFLPFFEYLNSIGVNHQYNAVGTVELMSTPIWPKIKESLKPDRMPKNVVETWVRDAVYTMFASFSKDNVEEANYMMSEMKDLFGDDIFQKNSSTLEFLYSNKLTGSSYYNADKEPFAVRLNRLDAFIEFMGVEVKGASLGAQLASAITNANKGWPADYLYYLIRNAETDVIDLSTLNNAGIYKLVSQFANRPHKSAKAVLDIYQKITKLLNDKQNKIVAKTMSETPFNSYMDSPAPTIPVAQAMITIFDAWNEAPAYFRDVLLKEGYQLFIGGYRRASQQYKAALKAALQIKPFTEKQLNKVISNLYSTYREHAKKGYAYNIKNAILPNLLPKNQTMILQSLISEIVQRGKGDKNRSDLWQPLDKAEVIELKELLEKYVQVDTSQLATQTAMVNKTRQTINQSLIKAGVKPVKSVSFEKYNWKKNKTEMVEKELSNTWYELPWSLRQSSARSADLLKQFQEGGLIPGGITIPENKLPSGRPQMIFVSPVNKGLVIAFCGYTSEYKSYFLYIPFADDGKSLLSTKEKEYKLYKNSHSKSTIVSDAEAIIDHVHYQAGGGGGGAALTVRPASDIFPESVTRNGRKL